LKSRKRDKPRLSIADGNVVRHKTKYTLEKKFILWYILDKQDPEIVGLLLSGTDFLVLVNFLFT